MPSKHVTQYIEAYLDGQLSLEKQQGVDDHLAACRACARRVNEARRLTTELGPLVRSALGQPTPPPALRHQIRQALSQGQAADRSTFPWPAFGQILNTAGTLALIALLAFGAFVVVQGQLPGAEVLPDFMVSQPDNNGQPELSAAAPEPLLAEQPHIRVTPSPTVSSLGDSLLKLKPTPWPKSFN